MRFQFILSLALLKCALAAPQSSMESLAKAMGLDPKDGIASMVCQTFDGKSTMSARMSSMFGSPNGPGPDEKCMADNSGGTGKYKAHFVEDASLPDHTIYAPITPPAEPLPVIVWGNGFCMSAGTMFSNFLTEIASHGFVVIANGLIKANLNSQTKYTDIIKSIDWVTSNPAAKKYGNLETSQLAVAGQSCGGLEAYGASTDKRIKHTVLFNSGVIAGNSASQMSKLTSKVAYFLGGPKDIAQKNGDTDYKHLKVPALKASADIGHIGTYYQKAGGKMGRAAVAYFSWQLKGDQSFKTNFCSPPPDSTLIKDGFKVEAKNGMCS